MLPACALLCWLKSAKFLLLYFLLHILWGRLDKLNEGHNPEYGGEDGDDHHVQQDANEVDPLGIGMVLRHIYWSWVLTIVIFTSFFNSSSESTLLGTRTNADDGLRNTEQITLEEEKMKLKREYNHTRIVWLLCTSFYLLS